MEREITRRGLIVQQFSQFACSRLAERDFGLAGIIQDQAKAVARVWDNFFYVLKVHQVPTMRAEKTTPRQPFFQFGQRKSAVFAVGKTCCNSPSRERRFCSL